MKNIRSTFSILGLASLFAVIPAHSFASSEVVSLSNQTTGNKLQIFSVQAGGSLVAKASIPTGGIGTGSGLGSQGAVSFDEESGLIAAVNAGDNTVSIFHKEGESIHLTSRVASGGFRPVSTTIRGHIVYVLNQGDANHASGIQGFRVVDGHAHPINGGSSALSATFVNPAQVSFSPNGRSLVITEKGTNSIDVVDVNSVGAVRGFHSFASAGPTPFGFAFSHRGELFVTEAFGGAANASAVSAYRRNENGALVTISASVPTTQTAACWAAVTPDDRFVFAANAGSGTISTYGIGAHGIIELVGNSTPIKGSTPVDMAISENGHTVYLLAAGIPGIVSYHVANDGTLTQFETDQVVKGSAGIAFLD